MYSNSRSVAVRKCNLGRNTDNTTVLLIMLSTVRVVQSDLVSARTRNNR